MGIFGTSSPFDQDVERATSETSTSEEWGLILEICDRAGASGGAARDCLRAVLRRLAHPDPHVQVHAATLLDACVANCGRAFHLEVASRDFEAEFRRLLARAQPAVALRLRVLLRKWADGEFRDDPQLDLIPSLHAKLAAEAGERPAAPAPADAAPAAPAAPAAAEQREREELARAIALSLRESGGAGGAAAGSLYPRVEAPAPAPAAAPAAAASRTVRALYDFEAAEDNELTFLAGELVHVTECSDPNWWKGRNERGEGLFPANFVTADLSEPVETEAAAVAGAAAGAKSVQFAEAEEAARIDEAAIDSALAALHEADPTAAHDAPRLAALEARAAAAGPLVDTALERADRRHARLTQLSADLVDALNLYHDLMRDPRPLYAPAGYGPPRALPPHAAPPHAVPPHALPQHALPTHAVPPHAVPPQAMPPHAMPPQTLPPHASLPPRC